MRACIPSPTPRSILAEGMMLNVNSGRAARAGGDTDSRPETWEAELCFAAQLEKLPPCQANCPSGTDIRGWINIIAQRQKIGLSPEEAFARAWRRLVECNPLPAVLGRVCPHTCESQCNRAAKEGAVSIHAMERFIGDWALAHNLPLPTLQEEGGTESIGVIGSGPAGLSFAYQMARRGYRVTIYEQHGAAGGMLRYGIPPYRLSREVLQGEIDRILRLGVELRLNTCIGREIALPELRAAHSALFVAIGAVKPHLLGIPGEDGPGVLAGTEFMYHANQGHQMDLGDAVVVVGGGNTAIDAARAARRRGAVVTLLYRRTREEMPAIDEEVEDALAEGVRMDFLAAPIEIRRKLGQVVAVVVQRMALGEPDASGRPRPVALADQTYEIDASLVIPAVSQQPDWQGLEELCGDEMLRPDELGRLGTDSLAGGDVLGLGTVTRAIGDGRRAAEALHAALRRKPLPCRPGGDFLTNASMHLDHYPSRPRIRERHQPVEEWLSNPDREIRTSIDEDQFVAEASRCLSCGNCFGCQLCWMYCNAGAFERNPEVSPGRYFFLDPEQCQGCGKCLELCPCGYLSADPTPQRAS